MLKTKGTLALAAGALLSVLAMTATSSAGEPAKANLGPVGPKEPILATVGSSRLVAYYEKDGGKCAVNAVLFRASPIGGGAGSTRVQVALHPGELFHFDNVEGHRIVMACAPHAKALTVLNPGDIRTASTAIY